MIRPMEARDKEPVLGLVRATGFFTEAEGVVAQELIDVYRETLQRVNAKEIGTTHLVLVEGPSRKSSHDRPELTGRTDTFARVVFPDVVVPDASCPSMAVHPRPGDYVAVTIEGGGATLVGRPIARTTARAYFAERDV